MSGNICRHYLEATAPFGDFVAFQHAFRDHMRSELVADIAAMSAYSADELGLKAGDVYTIFLPPCIEAIEIFLALNARGVVVNFVHPNVPPDTLAVIFENTGSRGIALMADRVAAYADAIRARGIPVLLCSSETYAAPDKFAPADVAFPAGLHGAYHREVLSRFRDSKLEFAETDAEDVAIYLQGGGTTGKSRTIMLTQANVIFLMETYRKLYGPARHPGIDTELSCMPNYHVFGLFLGGIIPMSLGYRMVFLARFDADVFIEHLRLNHVIQFRGVPNMFRKLIDHPGWDGAHLASVEYVSCGGDSLTTGLLGEVDYVFAKNGSKARLVQGYGLTECCGTVTVNDREKRLLDSIGKPLPGVTVEVWDDDHRPVQDGTVGEIAVSGPTVMKGYLSDDLKADIGVYRDSAGRRWMITGDLGYRKNGYLYFAGRKKRLVIISGYNVYPLNIEKVVRELPQVKESCAVQGFDDRGKIIIRLYVILAEPAADPIVVTEAIQSICAEKLPSTFVPREVRYVADLPRTKVGKVDFMKLTQQTPADPVYGG